MYIPAQFEISDKEEIFSFIEKNSFGQLISQVDGRLFSTHMPFLLTNDRSKIVGHLAKKNPQHLDIEKQEILISLEGPHDYISPSWFSTPGVPTWNYQAVHIYGTCRLLREETALREIVNSLTEKYESSSAFPWQPEYSDALLGAIIGIEVTIKDIQCKYKLSQNRSPEDRSQTVERLRSVGSNRLAEAMDGIEP